MDPIGQPAPSTAPVTAANAPAQPSGFPPASPQTAPPAPDQVTISKADHDRFTRYEQQVKGISPYGEFFSEIGVRSVDDLRSLVNPALTAKRAGVDLDGLLGTLTRPHTQQTTNTTATGQQPAPQVDVLREVDKKLAARDHQSALTQQDQFVASTIAKLAGPSASAEERVAVEAIAEKLVYAAMTPYPPSSPLYGDFKPLTQADMAKIEATLTDHWTKLRGAALASLGQAASQAPRAQATGQPSLGSASGSPTTPSRQDAVSQARQWIASQMGTPMSST
jgi:hypothetical protein